MQEKEKRPVAPEDKDPQGTPPGNREEGFYRSEKGIKNSRREKKQGKRPFWVYPANYKQLQSTSLRIGKLLLSVVLMAFSMNYFMIGANLIPGGFVGISMLAQEGVKNVFGINIPFSYFNIGLNLLPAILAFFTIGKKFVLLSVLNIVLYSFLVDLIPTHPLTDDMLINIAFGAAIHGAGLALALNANASTGGTDFVAMTISNKYNITVWNYVFILNALIIIAAGFIFGVEAALYSILFQFLSTVVINRAHQRYQKNTIWIVTENPEPIATDLMKLTHHAITSFEGVGRYTEKRRYLLYMVVSKEDVPKVKKYLKEKDCNVFMNITKSEELNGRFYLEPLD